MTRRLLSFSTILVGMAFLLFFFSTQEAQAISCVQCEQLFGNDSSNRYRQTLDQSTLNACADSGAKSEYASCQKNVEQEKSLCRTDCQVYLEGACYEECEQNYQECLSNCVSDYNTASNSCVVIFLDQCYPACIDQCTTRPNPCAKEAEALQAAQANAEAACEGVVGPGRLLAPDAKIASCDPDETLVTLCRDRENALNEANATLARAEARLEALQKERQDMAFKHPNEVQDLMDLEREYASFDLEGTKRRFEEALEEFNWIKLQANFAWYEAIAGTAGPIGVITDGLSAIFSWFTGQDTAQKTGGAGIMVLEELIDAPIGILGALYDGIELEEFKKKTAEAERQMKQALSAYRAAKSLMNQFKSRGAYDRMIALQTKVPKDTARLVEIDIEIPSLEKQIPVMRHTRDIAQELHDRCQADLKNACEMPYRETRCQEALKKQRAAEVTFNDCKAKNP